MLNSHKTSRLVRKRNSAAEVSGLVKNFLIPRLIAAVTPAGSKPMKSVSNS